MLTAGVDRAVADEAELVAALRRADPDAFDAVYELYRASLFSFLVRLSGSTDLAYDLLQETWLRLARHATELAPDTRLAPWLFTVARNLHTSHRRWTVLDASRLRELGLWRGERGETPFERAAASETEARLERALAELPLKYREAVLLVASGLEPAEAAQIIGIEPPALRQRLARGRAMIRERLEHDERERP
jgi:RNA polymerase sigma-70 factor (ECF subfamily)